MSAASTLDNELVARVVAQQDASAFGELVRRHQSQIRIFLRKLTRDIELADDLAQDAFMHAWDKLHTYKGKGSFIGWLLKVAYTTFLQSKRKSNRYGEILQQLGEEKPSMSVDPSNEITDLDRFLALEEIEVEVGVLFLLLSGDRHPPYAD